MEIATKEASNLPRKLGLIDALAIVIGMVIGGGIFLVPNLIARELKSADRDSGGLDICRRDLVLRRASMRRAWHRPTITGGQYVFLREAYGPLVEFLCGWSYVAPGYKLAWGWRSAFQSRWQEDACLPVNSTASTTMTR